MTLTIKKILLTLGLLLSCITSAQQQTVDGMQLHGMAEYTQLKRPFYIASLYSTWPKASGDILLQLTGRKRMALKVTERWTARTFVGQWTQGMLINGREGAANRLAKEFEVFNNLPLNNFIPGDEILIDTYPSGKTAITINGTVAATFNEAEFFELLLGAWIGPKPPTTQFKQDILSGAANQEMQLVIDSLSLNNKRKQEVAGWY